MEYTKVRLCRRIQRVQRHSLILFLTLKCKLTLMEGIKKLNLIQTLGESAGCVSVQTLQ